MLLICIAYLKLYKLKITLISIEKLLNKLLIDFKTNNDIHLVATTKDLGLI